MIHKLKKIKHAAMFMAFLSGITIAEASPSRTSGTAIGLGVGAKFLNLKNISTRTTSAIPPVTTRSNDSFANSSSAVFGIYGRKYMPDFLSVPTFLGLEFDYLADLKKNSIYTNLNANPALALDTGYKYREYWDARAMLGAQLWSWTQLDLWAQAGLQLTYFEYTGQTTDINNVLTSRTMHNKLALAPAAGLEVRYSVPGLIDNSIVTDFILGWTAGYRSAFTIAETAPTGDTYTMAMSSNWSHTVGLKVMFRF